MGHSLVNLKRHLINISIAQDAYPRCKLEKEISLPCIDQLELHKNILGVDTEIDFNIMKMGQT